MDGSEQGPDDTLLDPIELDEDPAATLDEADQTMLSPPPFDGRLGHRLGGRYEVLRTIGEGGMAVVYECQDHRDGGRCAVKVLDAEVVGGAFGERFAREIRIISSIDSPYVVKVLDEGQLEDGRPYMVEELLLGRTLAEALEEEGPFEAERAARIADGVLAALEAAHAAGVVHRDLKPDNVFLQSPGAADERPKVLDFGFAKELDRIDRRLTHVGTAVGTPKYMAPEQFLQSEVDGRADLYAVGVLLHRMVRGRAPFEPDDPAPRHVRVMHEAPRVGWMHINCAAEPVPALGPRLQGVVDRLLAKKPSGRYADAAAARRALAGEQADERAGARAPARPAQAPTLNVTPPMRARQTPWLAVLTGLAVATLTALVAVYLSSR